MTEKSKNWLAMSIDASGRVILDDAELDRLADDVYAVLAGGSNETCGGTNLSCTNAGCNGSWNASCANQSCSGTSNAVSCTNIKKKRELPG